MKGKLLFIRVEGDYLSYVYPPPGVAIKHKKAVKGWEEESKKYIKMHLPTQIAVGTPIQDSPEQTLAYLAVSHSKHSVATYQDTISSLRSIGYDLFSNEKFLAYLNSYRVVKNRTNSQAKPNTTMVPHAARWQSEREHLGETGMQNYGSTRRVDSRTLINKSDDPKCRSIDDAATKLLREAGYFD